MIVFILQSERSYESIDFTMMYVFYVIYQQIKCLTLKILNFNIFLSTKSEYSLRDQKL